ncbi:acriflavin resistance protein [Propionigenium maris DSM 9537]|uniref:Acriflavin resistance protein n=1 Tax=Propionigenium maris DSM 9537 TaxID=1123000 RepID=A0A9W6LN30_9FUSO|nr:efflux RND transporter periplasmic adaptor subunit [Propionigenium maris]GLI56464.1 acriflavin resistance protein [Propionigenium maris DSM 9537]
MKKALLLIMVILSLGACGKAEKGKGTAPATEKEEAYKSVRVEEIKKRDIVRNDISSGIIDPINEVAQVTETGGDIVEINYRNGDRVKAGDIIIRLRDQNVSSTYLSAEADLISAKSDYETKEINFKKFEKLYAENLISEDEFLSVRNAYNQSRSTLKMTEANYMKVKEDYDNLTMRAKISGVVTDMDVKLYEKIAKDKKIFTVVDDTIMRINTAVSGGEVNSLKVGGKAIIAPEGMYEDYEGTVYEINPVADPVSKKFAVKIELPNKSGELKKGMYSRVTIQTGEREGFVVPLESVVVKDLYSYIFIEEDGKAKQVRIQRGYSQPRSVEVISNELPDNFNVVVEGQFLLEDKDNLKVLD